MLGLGLVLDIPNILFPGPVARTIYETISSSPDLFSVLWSLLCIVYGIGLCLFIYKKPESKWVIVFMLVGIFLLRLPNLVLPQKNADESQWIANAGTFYNGAVLWKSVTGYTGGPLLFVPLCVMNILQIGLNYASIRLFGLVFCILPSVYFLWLLLKRMFDSTTALIGIIPLALFFAFAHTYDMVAYNSEHVPMLLTSISIYLLFLLDSNQRNNVKLVALGFMLGCFPMAKLQSLPIAAMIGALSVITVLTNKSLPSRLRLGKIVLLFGAAISPLLLTLIYLWSNDAIAIFYQDYILDNLLYTSTGISNTNNVSGHVDGIMRLFIFIPMFVNAYDAFVLYISLILILGITFFQFGNRSTLKLLLDDRAIIFSFLILLAAFVAVIFPGNPFHHYQILFIIPITLFTCILLGKIFEQGNFSASNKFFRTTLIAVTLLAIIVTLYSGNPGVQYVRLRGHYKLSEVSQVIRNYAKPNEKMAVWGWAERYYVETGLVQSHREPHPAYRVFKDYNSEYVNQYVDEMNATKPVVFLDEITAISFYYTAPEIYRHENYPELNNYVNSYYTLIADKDGKRIYVRNDRVIKATIN